MQGDISHQVKHTSFISSSYMRASAIHFISFAAALRNSSQPVIKQQSDIQSAGELCCCQQTIGSLNVAQAAFNLSATLSEQHPPIQHARINDGKRYAYTYTQIHTQTHLYNH